MEKAAEKKSKRSQRDYTLGFKLQVVAEVERGDLTYKQAQKKYRIQGRSTVLVWLRKHGRLTWDYNPSAMPQTPNQRIKELEALLAASEKRAREAELKARLLDTIIDVAEGQMGIQIRKKPVAGALERLRQKEQISLSVACRLLGFSRQAYYQRQARVLEQKQIADQLVELAEQIRMQMPRLGTRKLYHLLQEQLQVGRDKLFTILRERGLLIKPRKSYHKTTDSKHWMKKHRNLVEGLKIERPEQVWAADITYIPTREGHSYLSLVTDAYSKKIMGYHLSEDLRAEGPLQALRMAVGKRKYGFHLIHHSDRGLPYCAAEYQQLLEKAQIRPSMTEKYDPYQNAVAERVNGILKDEFALERGFAHHLEAVAVIRESVGIYNRLRPHLSCHFLTPEQMHAQQELEVKQWKKKTSNTNALEVSI
ncbi:IS3 family transposase [Pontibacter sp. HSC-14F20]|uniref:IS3 family transposase n=1 Tax=Pontibacter sp. HSC-14F20 TaxID=2864136 RepID=UPI001C73BB61|nr:IS3 family transposase [Pontibacter sp. HSC-14F20]MBX0332763.1 IS3 family transposase [Pontibacter sp. HSC-14F20]